MTSRVCWLQPLRYSQGLDRKECVELLLKAAEISTANDLLPKSSPAIFFFRWKGDFRASSIQILAMQLFFPPLRAQAATSFVDYFKMERTFVPPSCKLYSRTSGAVGWRDSLLAVYAPLLLPVERVCGTITLPSRSGSRIFLIDLPLGP